MMRRFIYLVLITFLITGCDDGSVESKVKSAMNDFIKAVNDKDSDDLISVTHPSVFNYISKAKLAEHYINNYIRFTKVKKLNKLYGPYKHDGLYYVLADFKFQRGKVLLKRRYVDAYVFISENKENWQIVPFEFDRMGYYFSRYNDSNEWDGDVENYGPVPLAVLSEMKNEYVIGSED